VKRLTLLALALALLLPAAAQASTTVGVPRVGNYTCNSGFLFGAPNAIVPAGGGQITAFSIGTTHTGDRIDFKILRPDPFNPQHVTIVGSSGIKTLNGGNVIQTVTLDSPIAVQRGDMIGYYAVSTIAGCASDVGTGGSFASTYSGADPGNGSSFYIYTEASGIDVDVSATLGASDTASPQVICASADGTWHADDVSLACTASDTGSGLADPSDASFSLTTSVATGSETANASTGTKQVCDTAGNCATAGPIAGNEVDRKAPSVSCDKPDGVWHALNVTLDCAGTDGGSGMAGTNPVGLSTSVAADNETVDASTGSDSMCDAVGNCAPVGPISGNEVDRKAPSITINSPASGDSYMIGSSHAAEFGCADGGSLVATCLGSVDSATNVDTSSVGPHTFTVDATDNVSNAAEASAGYSVIWPYSGFFAPVNNKDADGNYVLNTTKAGSAIPVKFSLGGDRGLNVLAAEYPGSGSIACNNTATTEAVEQTVTAGSSALSYDSTSSTYIYVWKTAKSWSGTCRQLTVKLTDGTVHKASFKFS
jgi:hypothetical protein